MKTKQVKRKLTLNKTTIVNLETQEKNAVKAGYLPTDIEATCDTWCGVCLTRASCVATCYYSCYCRTNDCDPETEFRCP